ncbi:MAG: GNAT family N-acetyltransferase [Flavobacteriales bacterium]|jgi:GNAT superfamily N-acetyltransferase|nr:GNAT family N-acetyltransferase [Flavobacteriales bacterium]
MEYRTERISGSNFSAFMEIIDASFKNQALDEAYFRRKFDTTYTGHAWLGYLAFDQETNEPAAYYGVFPTLVSQNGEAFVAAQSGDTATHPSHRGKGLFRMLHDLTMELCREEGIAFIFGFPNQNSYPGFKKFNWSDRATAETLTRLVVVPLPVRVFRKFLPGSFAAFQKKSIRKRRMPNVTLDAIEADRSLVAVCGQPMVIPRSRGYMVYKLALGSELLKLKSGVAWVAFRGNQIVIGDLFGNDHQKILEDLMRLAARCGFDVLVLATASERLRKLLVERDGFSIKSSNKLIINCLGKRISDEDLFFTSGDYDVFGSA